MITDLNTMHYGHGEYLAEASELGLAPGEWPELLETTLGNKQKFRLVRTDPFTTRYEQIAGTLSLTVLND